MIFNEKQKTQPIERGEVWEAFKEVRAGGESPGVDGITGKIGHIDHPSPFL